MLIYMIHELMTEKQLSIDEAGRRLNSHSGDTFEWYESLDCVSGGWRHSFFKKYLTMPPQALLRSLYNHLGEAKILSTIAYSMKLENDCFDKNAEAREKAFEILSNALGKLEGYHGRASLSTFISGRIQDTFRDKRDVIKRILDREFIISEESEAQSVDEERLEKTDAETVRRLLKCLIDVDEILVTANQPASFRQYSFLTAYQLWCFRQRVNKINEVSPNISFAVTDFNIQPNNREHVFVTNMFNELMPLVIKMTGTADIKTLYKHLSAKIHDVETNTGVNLPIRFTPLSGEAGGEWFEEILHGDIVEETKRNNFGLLIIAFVALGRLHNILESAGGVFPSFYPDLAKDDGYLAKFITLNDYLSHSKKVLTEIKSRGLPSSPDSFLCPMSYEVLPPAAPNYSSDFMRMFNLLVNYNAYINQLLDSSPEHRFALSSAYEVLNNGESPLVYLADELPAGMDRLNDFLIGKFEKIASELFPSGILYENLSPFLRKKQRIELLPSFIALYKAVLEIYRHFKNMIGVSAAMTEKTNRHSKSGKPFGIRVSAAEFSVIVTECEKLALLSKLQIESPVNHHTALTRIAAVLINDEEKAAQLIEYLTQERNIAYSHWEHLEQVMMFLYETSRQSKSMLFDFGKSTNTPPLLPNQLLQNFKAQAELKLSNVAKQTSQAIFRQRQYKKDGFGFVMSRGGMYITRFWGGDIYFQHTDGYHVSSKGELKIFD